MPKAEAFRDLGLFVLKDFLDQQCCERLIGEIRAAALDKALLTSGLDENVRRAGRTALLHSSGCWVRSRLRDLKLELERYFNVELEDCEHPQFLKYVRGDFFTVHADASSELADNAIPGRRKITIVVFLNGHRSDGPSKDFAGGELILYGLMKGHLWENCGLPVRPEPGLLLGFPSQTLHEVKPVTFGWRFSIASWFYSPVSPSTIT